MSPQVWPAPARRARSAVAAASPYLPTSYGDVTGLSITDTYGSGSFLVIAALTMFNAASGATRAVTARIVVDGAEVGTAVTSAVANNDREAMTVVALVTLTGASQTVKLQALASAYPAIDVNGSTLAVVPV